MKSAARRRQVVVRLDEQEVVQLQALADNARESLAQTLRRLLHERIDACVAGEPKRYCGGWRRAEKYRGAMFAVISAMEDALNNEDGSAS